MSKIIAITIGDIDGIGIELLLRAWREKKINNFILFTDLKILENYIKKKNIKVEINLIKKKIKIKKLDNKKINIFSFSSKSNEENTYKSLKYAYDFCYKKICIGIITLPLRKDLIKIKISNRFTGQTEFFQKIDKKKYSNMILYHKKLIISTLTTHVELRKISKIISNKIFLYNQIKNLNNVLKKDFNIINPKILISGINPHAGENGLLGKEEQRVILPIINKLKNKGVNIDGPKSADSLLIKKNLKKYNCFLFIYHDQALIPFKYISQFSGVNYTGNLDIIRTSPDHGTAYDLIGSNKISDRSLRNCKKLIGKIYKNRIINEKS